MRRGRGSLTAAIVVAYIASLAGPDVSPAAVGDFNGDGRDDLAVSAIRDLEASPPGSVTTIPGSQNGLDAAGSSLFTSRSPGMPELNGNFANDFFAATTVSADFDRDGFDELVISHPMVGVPGASVGAVNVLPGSPDGPTTVGLRQLSRHGVGVPEWGDPEGYFGQHLAVGDFDVDGYPDLAVTAIRADVKPYLNLGIAQVIYGGPAGLTGDRRTEVGPGVRGFPGGSGATSMFGSSLTVGDFNGDGADDLAVGDPWKRNGGSVDSGGVLIAYGAERTGLITKGSELLSQGSSGLPGNRRSSYFGYHLGSGDLNGDGAEELIATGSGGVFVLSGSPGGVRSRGARSIRVDRRVKSVAASRARGRPFRGVIETGFLNGDRRADLVLGGLVASKGPTNDVVIVPGRTGRIGKGARRLRKAITGLGRGPESDAGFGMSLAIGEFGRGEPRRAEDLVIAIPGSSLGRSGCSPTRPCAFGAVLTLYSDDDGPSPGSQQLLSQATPGIPGEPRPAESFGSSLGIHRNVFE